MKVTAVKHRVPYGAGHNVGSQCAYDIYIGLHVSGGQCIDRISVGKSMNGPDGSGKTILPHAGDLFGFGITNFAVGFTGAMVRFRMGVLCQGWETDFSEVGGVL